MSISGGQEGLTNMNDESQMANPVVDLPEPNCLNNGAAYEPDPPVAGTVTHEGVTPGPTPSNVENERTPLCKVELAGERFTGKINRDISSLIKRHFIEAKETWKSLDEDTRKNYWKAFKTKYEVPPENDMLIRSTFELVASERYKSVLFEARKKSMKQAKTSWIGDCINHKPEWIKDIMWEELVQEWSQDKWQCKSMKARRNRCTLKDGSLTKHCGGSMSTIEHKAKMAKELKRQPTQREVFNRTHKTQKGTGEYVDNRSKIVAAAYEANLITKYGSEVTASQVILDEEAWTEAVGGPSKGRLYGLGPVGGSSKVINQYSDEQVEQMINQRMQGMEDRVRESVAETMRAEFEKLFSANIDRALLGSLMSNS